jgi:thiamine biosynthesis lipoprotein
MKRPIPFLAAALGVAITVLLLGSILSGCTGSEENGTNRGARSGGQAEGRGGTGGAAGGVEGSSGTSAPEVLSRDDSTVTYRMPTMGTFGQVTLVGSDSVASFGDARLVEEAWSRVDSLMSNWTTTSEVARINEQADRDTVVVEPEVADVIETALRVGGESDGAFDITVEPLVRLWGFLGGEPRVPSTDEIEAVRPKVGLGHLWFDPVSRSLFFRTKGTRIDLGGIAKGYGVDAAAAALRADGVANALVDLSGNIRVMGAPPHRETWVVGIRDPRDRVPYFARLYLEDASLATSGNYEQFVSRDGKRYGHILDPRTGWPAEGLLSATVIAPSAMEADAWATALIVLGPDEAKRIVKLRPDLQAVLVQGVPLRDDLEMQAVVDTVWVEASLRDTIAMEEGTDSLMRLFYF